MSTLAKFVTPGYSSSSLAKMEGAQRLSEILSLIKFRHHFILSLRGCALDISFESSKMPRLNFFPRYGEESRDNAIDFGQFYDKFEGTQRLVKNKCYCEYELGSERYQSLSL
jgi:hypothetical protein